MLHKETLPMSIIYQNDFDKKINIVETSSTTHGELFYNSWRSSRQAKKLFPLGTHSLSPVYSGVSPSLAPQRVPYAWADSAVLKVQFNLDGVSHGSRTCPCAPRPRSPTPGDSSSRSEGGLGHLGRVSRPLLPSTDARNSHARSRTSPVASKSQVRPP